MSAIPRYLLCILLIAFTLMPGLSAADPELRDKSLSVPLLISEYQDADTPAIVAKFVEWSFAPAPVYIRVEDPQSRQSLAVLVSPPRAILVPGLLLTSLRWSSET